MKKRMNNMKKLFGVTIAMVTPFTKEDCVDFGALAELTQWLVKKGVNCLYPCGTTGEMLRLSVEERQKIAETVVRNAEGKANVFIHCGAMNQSDTIALLKHAEKIGADGAGIVTPAFFSANDRELEQYYITLSKSVGRDFPLYLYNIPQCSANDLKAEVAESIASQCENIVGIKYSLADINRTVDYLKINHGRFSVLHGCDRVFSSMLTLGCDGTVSGVAGVFPEPFVKVYESYKAGEIKEMQKYQKICVEFCDALKGGSNMSYFKEGLKIRGIPGGVMRRPQLDLTSAEVRGLRTALEGICKEAGIGIKI